MYIEWQDKRVLMGPGRGWGKHSEVLPMQRGQKKNSGLACLPSRKTVSKEHGY